MPYVCNIATPCMNCITGCSCFSALTFPVPLTSGVCFHGVRLAPPTWQLTSTPGVFTTFKGHSRHVRPTTPSPESSRRPKGYAKPGASFTSGAKVASIVTSLKWPETRQLATPAFTTSSCSTSVIIHVIVYVM